MTLAIAVFFISLIGIAGLFAAKHWEIKHDRALAPALRSRADSVAVRLRELLIALEIDAQKLPPEILHGSRSLLHSIALFLASLLRFLSVQAHRLADLVSHKHSFRRGAPRSEFLKKVLEHKNDNGTNSQDTTSNV